MSRATASFGRSTTSKQAAQPDRARTNGDVGELDEVVPAYATTVHKAQSSEDPAAVIPLATQHWSMLRRNLVYTAVTRGKRLVVVVGQPKARAIAVRGDRTRRRWSKLAAWLGGEREVARPAAETVG